MASGIKANRQKEKKRKRERAMEFGYIAMREEL
jgi:hypothetical protein